MKTTNNSNFKKIAAQIKGNYSNEPLTTMEQLRFIELLMENNYQMFTAIEIFHEELQQQFGGEKVVKPTQPKEEFTAQVRSDLTKFIQRYGSTYSFIGEQVLLSGSSIGKFVNGNVNLSYPALLRLEQFMKENYKQESNQTGGK